MFNNALYYFNNKKYLITNLLLIDSYNRLIFFHQFTKSDYLKCKRHLPNNEKVLQLTTNNIHFSKNCDSYISINSIYYRSIVALLYAEQIVLVITYMSRIISYKALLYAKQIFLVITYMSRIISYRYSVLLCNQFFQSIGFSQIKVIKYKICYLVFFFR